MSLHDEQHEAEEASKRRLARIPYQKREQCGTPAGYLQHNRRKEVACPECRQAWSKYYRERRRKRKR